MASAKPTQFDLTSLVNLQQYLQVPAQTQADSADELQRFITATSMQIWRFLSRLPIQQFNEHRDGNGGMRMMFKHRPVKSLQSLQVNGVTIPQSSDGVSAAGYFFDALQLTMISGSGWLSVQGQAAYQLYQYEFIRGQSNVVMQYVAGWIPVTALAWVQGNYTYGQVILDPNGNIQLCTTPGATGATVPTNFSQSVGGATQDGTVTWTMTPTDPESYELERACLEWVATRWRRRMHLDERTHSVGGMMTTSFAPGAMPPEVTLALQQLRNVAPIY